VLGPNAIMENGLNDLGRHKMLIICIDKFRPRFATVPGKGNGITRISS